MAGLSRRTFLSMAGAAAAFGAGASRSAAIPQTVLLGSRADMDDVAAAVRRIQAGGAAIARTLSS